MLFPIIRQASLAGIKVCCGEDIQGRLMVGESALWIKVRTFPLVGIIHGCWHLFPASFYRLAAVGKQTGYFTFDDS